jgi:putative membrane protein
MAASTLGQIPLWRRLRTGLSPNYVHQHHHQHDEITFRDRMGQPLSIPQAERYSGRDWWHNLLTLPTSIILHRIRMPILWQMLWAAGVVLLHTFRPITCSMKPHTLLGSALGLLLVFRTNAGYNRMWEGRKIWENVVNKSRDMARFCDLYRDDLGEERILRIGKLLAVFPLILEEHLKGFKDTSMYKHLLAKNELQELEQTRYNRPLYIVDLLGKEARAIAYSESWSSRERLALIDMVHKFSNYVGACERLVSEPVPLHYVRHTSRMLSLW